MIVVGPTVNLNPKKGFADFGIWYYKEWTHNAFAATGQKDVEFDGTVMFNLTWGIPIALSKDVELDVQGLRLRHPPEGEGRGRGRDRDGGPLEDHLAVRRRLAPRGQEGDDRHGPRLRALVPQVRQPDPDPGPRLARRRSPTTRPPLRRSRPRSTSDLEERGAPMPSPAIREQLAAFQGLKTDLFQKDFLLTWEHPDEEIQAILTLAETLKQLHQEGYSYRAFDTGLAISIFRDNSTRTRFSFASAANALGLALSELDEQKSQVAHGETVRETANMISFLTEVIGIRDDMFLGEGNNYMREVGDALTTAPSRACCTAGPASSTSSATSTTRPSPWPTWPG